MTAVPENYGTTVKIELSSTGPDGNYGLIADSLPNNGRYQLVWPDNINSYDCYLRLIVMGQDTAFAISPAAFSIISDITEIFGEINPPENAVRLTNYPNPFNAETIIEFDLPTSSPVRIAVFDLLGREIDELHSGVMQAGRHQFIWSAENNSSGIYLCRIISREFTETRRMVLLK